MVRSDSCIHFYVGVHFCCALYLDRTSALVWKTAA
jgi:hypothetical protein